MCAEHWTRRGQGGERGASATTRHCPRGFHSQRLAGVSRLKLWPLIAALLVVCVSVGTAAPADAATPGISIYFTENIPVVEAPASLALIETALLALLDSAELSIDACLLSLNRESVRDALVRAHQRGVRVRVACDNEYYPDFRHIENVGIEVIHDNRSSTMHNKFFVVDRHTVWTGSTNMTDEGFSSNHNNSPAIVCPALALAYETEFEEMFVEEDFGTHKTDNTPHVILCDSITIETYFSPSDGSQAELIDEIGRADSSIYFAIYYFTADEVREALIQQAADGVVVKGIYDAMGAGCHYSEYEPLCSGGIPVKVENLRGILHHKFMVIDLDGDDPVVVTGSYNWTTAGNEENDENTLIIHDRAIAETYYAEWQHIWAVVPRTCGCNMPWALLPLVIRSCRSSRAFPHW